NPTFDRSWIEPVRYLPAANFTVPPPAFSAAASASLIAVRSLVVPSPLAPSSVIENDLSGICGRAGSAANDGAAMRSARARTIRGKGARFIQQRVIRFEP